MRVDEWANGKEVKSVLYEIRNPLSSEQRRAISDHVKEMHAILEELRNSLGLEGIVRSVDKMIVSSCSVLWASLAELEGRHLRRYGELPPGLSAYLDPKVALLTQKLGNIAEITAKGMK